ncbi:hypothetical protein JCM11251_007898 [Rhodosporidiobolus azoricus]
MFDRRLQRALVLSSYALSVLAAGSQTHFAPADCIESASAPEINHLLKSGGAGTAVVLCPYAQVSIDPHGAPIVFTAPRQSIYTRGFPEDHSRATIVIENPEGDYSGDLTTAIKADCDKCRGVIVRNLHVDGGRDTLGGIEGGDALIRVGGAEGEQEVRSVDAWGARGYAVVHASEGLRGSCRDVIIADNIIHTAGEAPLDAFLNAELARLRDGTPAHRGQERPGQWTDGISVACAHSTVCENTIRDVSGIGIALRGAPGTQVHQNTIVARDRDMLVGISLVANPVFHNKIADLGGVVVRENRIHAASAMIRVGISTGAGAWATDEIIGDHEVAHGSEIVRNRLSSYTGYYAYAIALSDARGLVVQDNAISASIWGFETSACYDRPVFVPPSPLIRDPRSVHGNLQSGFTDKHYGFLLCVGPGTASSSEEMSRHQINDASVRSYHSSIRDGKKGGRNGRGRGRPADIPQGEMHPRGSSYSARGAEGRKHAFRAGSASAAVEAAEAGINDLYDFDARRPPAEFYPIADGPAAAAGIPAIQESDVPAKMGMRRRALKAPRRGVVQNEFRGFS